MFFESQIQANIENFDQLIGYYFPNNAKLSKAILTANEVKLRHFFLALVCFSGAYPFVVTANEYAASTFDDSISWRVYFSFSAAIWSAGFFYNATITFLDTYRREEIPAHLETLLVNTITPSQRLFKKIILGAGATISALPLAILTLLYSPSNMSAWAKCLLFSIVLIDDAILHFLPIELAFQNPIYRFPIYPFEKLYEYIETARLSSEEQVRKEIEEKNAQAYTTHLIAPLINALAQTKAALSIKAASVDRYSQVCICLPKELERNHFIHLSSQEKLRFLIQYGQDTPLSAQDTWGHYFVAFLGSIWGEFGDAGFILTTAEQMISLMGSVFIGILLVAVPLYFYAVLVSFFGSMSLLTLWSYMTDHAPGDIKLSLMFKLYPQAAVIYALFSLAVLGACYGVPVELVETTVSSDSSFRAPLIAIATTSAIIVVTYILIEFYCAILRDVTLYGEINDSQWVVQLGAHIDEFTCALSSLKGDKLLHFLEDLEPSTLTALGYTQDTLSECKEELDPETLSLRDNTNSMFRGSSGRVRASFDTTVTPSS